MKTVRSWGRLSADLHQVIELDHASILKEQICNASDVGIARGMGRSYGDACLNPRKILWSTSSLDHFVSFDEKTGRLICESGVLLGDIQSLFVSRGWMLPVTPGSQFITVGGAVANDVHGKNHHSFATFGNHVCSLTLYRTTGEVLECNPNSNSDLFFATIGGLGLTGLIGLVELQLRRVNGPMLETETIPYQGLDEFLCLAQESVPDWEYTVSWVDSLSPEPRGLFMRANHQAAGFDEVTESPNKTRSFPFVPPFCLINTLTARAFNSLYYKLNSQKKGLEYQHYQSFFYPLDRCQNWNWIYGPSGFYQYQCVVPFEGGVYAIEALLDKVRQSGYGSFLGVLKTFGSKPSLGRLSFAQAGITLALDFPNKGKKGHDLFDALDQIVAEAGGRLYLAKDARMSPRLFLHSYPEFNRFSEHRDPGVSSALSRRLMGV